MTAAKGSLQPDGPASIVSLHTHECVWDHKCLVVFEIGGVRLARIVLRVVIDFVAAEVPPPRVLIVADEALVADTVNGRISCK